MIGYDQIVSQSDNWLHNGAEKNRQFVKVVHLPIGESWDECTDAERIAWQNDHGELTEPEEVEPVAE